MLQQEKLEKERMKQVVLGIHERQEEEDYQGNSLLYRKYIVHWCPFMPTQVVQTQFNLWDRNVLLCLLK